MAYGEKVSRDRTLLVSSQYMVPWNKTAVDHRLCEHCRVDAWSSAIWRRADSHQRLRSSREPNQQCYWYSVPQRRVLRHFTRVLTLHLRTAWASHRTLQWRSQQCELRKLLFLLFPFPSSFRRLPCPPFSSRPYLSPPFYFPSLPPTRNKAPKMQPKGLGECCELPQVGLGWSPSRHRIWCIIALKYEIWWQQFYFPENQLNKLANLVKFKRGLMFCLWGWEGKGLWWMKHDMYGLNLLSRIPYQQRGIFINSYTGISK